MNDLTGLTERLAVALRDPDFETWEPEELQDILTWAVASEPRLFRALDPTVTTITLTPGTYYYDLPPEVLRLYRVDRVDSSSVERGPLSGSSWEVVGDTDAYSAKLHVHPAIASQGGTLRLNGYGRYSLGPVATPTTAAATAAAASTNVKFTAVAGFAAGDLVTFGTSTKQYRLTSVGTAGSGGTGCNISPALVAAVTSGDAITEVNLLPPDRAVPLILALARVEALSRVVGDRARFKQWMAASKGDASPEDMVYLKNDADRDLERIRRSYPAWEKPVPGRV